MWSLKKDLKFCMNTHSIKVGATFLENIDFCINLLIFFKILRDKFLCAILVGATTLVSITTSLTQQTLSNLIYSMGCFLNFFILKLTYLC